jgi:hypothetical protein
VSTLAEIGTMAHVYRMRTAYNENGDSPWDALWYDGDDEDLEPLDGQMRLAAVWSGPCIRLEKRDVKPDFFVFQLYYATTQAVCRLLSPLVGDTVEFLPLEINSDSPLFVMHPLLRVEFDEKAVVNNKAGENITVVRTYSFDAKQFEEDMHVFQVRQAIGSAARNAGYPCSGVLVSAEFKQLCEKNNLQGIVFESVWEQETPPDD